MGIAEIEPISKDQLSWMISLGMINPDDYVDTTHARLVKHDETEEDIEADQEMIQLIVDDPFSNKEEKILELSDCGVHHSKIYGPLGTSLSYVRQILIRNNRVQKKEKKEVKAVMQFSGDGQFIAEHASLSQAARATGIAKFCVWATCNGEQKTAGGFKFMFKEEG